MKSSVSINRSGRAIAVAGLPAVVESVEIAQDPSAPMLDLAVYLMAPSINGAVLRPPVEYLDGVTGAHVFALLCTQDPDGSSVVMSVKFVANLLGMSEPFLDTQHGNVAASTICMKVLMRPGQMGEYRYVWDSTQKWNIKVDPPVPASTDIIFRPSFDVIQLNVDGVSKLYSSLSFDGTSLMRILRESAASDPVKKSRILITTSEGGTLDLANTKVQGDGISLSPCVYPANGSSFLLYLSLWDVVGLLSDASDPNLVHVVWSGLRSPKDSINLMPVLIPQDSVAAAASSLGGDLAVGVCESEFDVPLV